MLNIVHVETLLMEEDNRSGLAIRIYPQAQTAEVRAIYPGADSTAAVIPLSDLLEYLNRELAARANATRP